MIEICACGCGGELDLDSGRRRKRFLPHHHLRLRRPERVKGRRAHGAYILLYRPDHPRAITSGSVFEHIAIVEQAVGHYLKRPAVVHHINDDGADNRNQNLVALENNSEHKSLHRRRRILRAGGNPWTQQICCTCKRVMDLSQFQKRTDRGVHNACVDCERTRSKLRTRRIT